MLAKLRGRVGHAGRLARGIARSPAYGVEEAWEDLLRRRERPAPDVEAAPSPAWEQTVHRMLGAPWPCPQQPAFDTVWDAIQERFRERELPMGRGVYGGWDDGERALARAAWCATRHLRPAHVVETGVARGITSRTILEALSRDDQGRLWSIDLPPLRQDELAEEIGIAVPPELRDRWTLIRGSSRRRLRGLLGELGEIDLFVHDSLHSQRNIRFELDSAWPVVRPGGAMIVDDVHFNAGFHLWREQAPEARSVICLPDDRRALFAVVVKPPA